MAITITEELTAPIFKITFDWLTATGGDASGTMTASIKGQPVAVVFVPDTSTTAPTDQHDITLTDASSIDILAGRGANLSNVHSTVIVDDLLPIGGNKVTCTVANGGNAKGGNVYLFVRSV